MTHTDESSAERFDHIDERFDLVDRRFDQTDRAIREVDRRIDQTNLAITEGFGEVKEIRNEMWRLYRGLIVSAFAIVACLIGVILTNAG